MTFRYAGAKPGGDIIASFVDRNGNGRPDRGEPQASAKVTRVTFTTLTQATVAYDVYLNGAVALPNAEGTAVLEGGVWKIAQASFCSLVSLGASGPIPGCS